MTEAEKKEREALQRRTREVGKALRAAVKAATEAMDRFELAWYRHLRRWGR